MEVSKLANQSQCGRVDEGSFGGDGRDGLVVEGTVEGRDARRRESYGCGNRRCLIRSGFGSDSLDEVDGTGGLQR